MTAATMGEWLNMFKAKMKKENRSVILLDNDTCHPKVTLSNVKIPWFPADATSALHPMDMVVIYTFKSHYARFPMRYLISDVEAADSSYAIARSVSVLDAVNWIGLALKKSEAETVKKSFAKAGFGERDVADNLEEANENIPAISNLCQGKEISCDTKNLVRSNDHLATHYSFESATALLAVRNRGDVEHDDEEEEEEERGEAAAGEQDISMNICTHEQTLHCISEVMQFAINSNSFSLLDVLYTVKDCIQKDMITKRWKQVALLDLCKKSQ
jgi:hypothetical protein